MPDTPRRRSLLWTVPLYAVMAAIIALDVWAAAWWARVGGPLGWSVVAVVSVVALLLGLLLVIDARRQWLLGHALQAETGRNPWPS